MFSSISFLFLLFSITRIQSQNNPIDSNLGTCSCDLINGTCDVSCCCDVDCSFDDRKTFQCNTQSTCFHHIPIYKSNSPHIVQKKDDRICVDYTQNENTNQMFHEEIDSSTLPRSINIQNSVSAPAGTVVDLSTYQAGSPVFRYIISPTSTASYYTLPVPLFNSFQCSGSQPITYMKDFSSTCDQLVTSDTCNNELDTTKYLNNNFCLITNPSFLAGNISNSNYICCNGNGSPSSPSPSTCSNSLQSLTLTIFYSNPVGIQNCTVVFGTTNGAINTAVKQTLSVRFVKFGPSASSSSRSGNPGYIPGAPLIAGNAVGNTINRTSGLMILRANDNGRCLSTSNQAVTFGVNVQSTCLRQLTTTGSCPSTTDLLSIFGPNDLNNFYVAGKGNSDPANIGDNWLRVTFCTSSVGSTGDPVCQQNSIPNPPSGQCYTRLDIEVTFANFGSVTNLQPILGAVTYYFQSVGISSTTKELLLTQTVTFQDISNPPMTEGDLIPRPNTRLLGDFFYPFSLSRAGHSLTFSSIFYLSICFLLFLM